MWANRGNESLRQIMEEPTNRLDLLRSAKCGRHLFSNTPGRSKPVCRQKGVLTRQLVQLSRPSFEFAAGHCLTGLSNNGCSDSTLVRGTLVVLAEVNIRILIAAH